jgi:predicted TPR repeat methyltransferase
MKREDFVVTLPRVSSQGHRALLTPPDLACGTGKYTHLLSTLGASAVTGYDISPTMISSALTTYPPSIHPNLHFDVLDCSLSSSLPVSERGNYDLVFSAWFLNYAGTERELASMFSFIEAAMVERGRFVGRCLNTISTVWISRFWSHSMWRRIRGRWWELKRRSR